MDKFIDYFLATAMPPSAFEKHCAEALQAGWMVHGPPFCKPTGPMEEGIYDEGTPLLCQAFLKLAKGSSAASSRNTGLLKFNWTTS